MLIAPDLSHLERKDCRAIELIGHIRPGRHRDDPRTLLMAAAIFLATVLAASLLPALRASRIAPIEALREE